MPSLQETLSAGYAFAAPVVTLGAALDGPGTVKEPKVAFPTAMLNRHGLIAGATGTGKTKTLQLMAEQLSSQGVPVFVADIKGDVSGIAAPGARSPAVEERAASVGIAWEPKSYPTEFVSLTGQTGAQLRASVSGFGPLLLSKVLGLNETQTSVLTLVFKICDDQRLPLLDFADLRSVLKYLASDAGKPVLEESGGMSSATVGVLLRQMVELEAQGADKFFGEPEFDVRDLLHVTGDGRGVITALELSDAQDRPALFSTFLMWLLAELYQVLPEAGDLPKPKLVFFFDEAHLLFRDASRDFLSHVEQVVRLVRSKGVGIFFVTQTPKDVPDEILAQLGSRVQHALRAHTPDDEKNLRATVRTYPKTELYDLQETLTSLGIGEAIVTGLNPRGVPTPVIATRLAPPTSRMAPLTAEEFQKEFAESDLMRAYGTPVDRDSAAEMLARRLEKGEEGKREEEKPGRTRPSTGGGLLGALTSPTARALGRELIRGVFGMLKGKAPRRTTRSRW
jgi:DNA double-strand break repair helicase HerA and related ATPase